jgi:hypothetical protein
MRRTSTRDRAAASLYATVGAAALVGAVALGSPLLAAVGAVLLAFALLALRSFPIDWNW